MALTYVERHSLINATQFLARVESAIMKYAIYLHNANTTGPRGQWALNMIEDANARAAAVAWAKWYALENVAVAGTLTGEGATLDSDATDAALSSQIETQINNRYATS